MTTRSEYLTCDACGARTPRPPDCRYEPLWDTGWRWRGAPGPAGLAPFVPRRFVYSCPACPSVL